MKRKCIFNFNERERYVILLMLILCINLSYEVKMKVKNKNMMFIKNNEANNNEWVLNDYYYSLPPLSQLSVASNYNQNNSSIFENIRLNNLFNKSTVGSIPFTPENVPKDYITPKINEKSYKPKNVVDDNSELQKTHSPLEKLKSLKQKNKTSYDTINKSLNYLKQISKLIQLEK